MSIGLLDNLILVRTFFFIFPRDFLVFLCLPGPVCPIYLSVYRVVTVPKALDPENIKCYVMPHHIFTLIESE